MQRISKINQITEPFSLTIGNFDGLHRGHQKFLDRMCDYANTNQLKTVVVTFDPHPNLILRPQESSLITLHQHKEELFSEQGIDYLCTLRFDRDFSNMDPLRFLDNFIFCNENLKAVFLGHDFAFGPNKSGSSQLIEKFSQDRGLFFEIQEQYSFDEHAVSSTLIRKLIANGEMDEANSLLGRKFFIDGRIIKGEGRGKQIGFPTANLDYSNDLVLPATGVYVTQTKIGSQSFNSVTNIGKNPTFNLGDKLHVETHILDFDEDIYGESIRVSFVRRLRPEQKFESVEKLIEQITVDVENSRKYFE